MNRIIRLNWMRLLGSLLIVVGLLVLMCTLWSVHVVQAAGEASANLAVLDSSNPDLSFAKDVTPTVVYSGDTVTYSYQVENTGDAALWIDVSDDGCAPVTFSGGDADSDGELDLSEVWTFGCEVQAFVDTVSTATITGTAVVDSVVVTSTAVTSVDVINPDILTSITCEGAGDSGAAGIARETEGVFWRVGVRNTGDVTLTNVVLTDSNAYDYGQGFTTLVGEIVYFDYITYPVSDVVNVVTAVGIDPLGNPVSDQASCSMHIIDPRIQVQVVAIPDAIYLGDSMTWVVTVTNTGDDPLTNVQMSDDGEHYYDDEPFDLDVGASRTFSFPATPGWDTTLNVVGEGRDSLDGYVADIDSASVRIINPDIEVDVTADPDIISSGGWVTWVVTVINTGDDPLTNVTLTDTVGYDFVPFSLDVGATMVFTYTTPLTTLVTTVVENEVTATGEDSSGGTVSDQDMAEVMVIYASIHVEEMVTPEMVHSGDAVVWEIVVSNNGDDPLTGIVVSDGNEHAYGPAFDLGIGESRVFSYTMTLSESVTNPVTAVGYDSLGTEISDSTSASAEVLKPAIEVVKNVSSAMIIEGESVQWTITVYNRGNVALYDVVVDDSNGMTFGPTSLTADDGDDGGGTDQVTWTYESYPLYDTINVATASGVDALGLLVVDEDQAGVEIDLLDDDVDGQPGYLDSNGDGDGVPDAEECPGGPPCVDSDSDGTPDYLDSDDDGDNIPTADEDVNGDGDPTNDDSDSDGTPNYLDPDDDGDGLLTADEDVNGDGNPANDDSDSDGTPDYLDPDDDGDGVLTEDEDVNGDGDLSNDDSDADGIPNYLDPDDDGDGVLTADEDVNGDGDLSNDDSDSDGIPDYLDPDDDGDGALTEDEDVNGDGDPTNDDSDDDGIPDYLDPDDDGDGVLTEDEDVNGDGDLSNDDSDGDGIPDYLDSDDDGDGIPTAEECPDGSCVDSDDDGTPDYLDLDSDGDGIPDADEWSEGPEDLLAGCSADDATCLDNDADGDGIPNYLDLDSDNDGIPDSEERLGDSDEDGIPDWLDPDRIYFIYCPIVTRGAP